LQKDQVVQSDIERFWLEIRKKQSELKFKWQKDYLEQEAKEKLDRLINNQ
jgi:hypothetical protein